MCSLTASTSTSPVTLSQDKWAEEGHAALRNEMLQFHFVKSSFASLWKENSLQQKWNIIFCFTRKKLVYLHHFQLYCDVTHQPLLFVIQKNSRGIITCVHLVITAALVRCLNYFFLFQGHGKSEIDVVAVNAFSLVFSFFFFFFWHFSLGQSFLFGWNNLCRALKQSLTAFCVFWREN